MSDSGTPEVEPPAHVEDDELPEVMSLRQAAQVTGMALTTLNRKLPDLQREGATKREDGSWAIPLEALHRLRLFDRVRGEIGTRADQSERPLSSTDARGARTGRGSAGTAGTLPPGALSAEQAAELRQELAASRERELVAQQRMLDAREREMEARERAASAEATANERQRTLDRLEAGYRRQLESSESTIRLLESKLPAPEERRRGWRLGGRKTDPGKA